MGHRHPQRLQRRRGPLHLLQKPADGTATVVSTLTGGVGSAALPFIGYNDEAFGSSVSNPTEEQFVLIDNLVIDDLAPASVSTWDLY
ncbi:MAG: hypothetical protein HC893_13010 [Chloroflexaceae bacterium]|nr:hypothetical protein [Chloroflexaceae bacterium]